jgi:alkylhydroperoxidase family enzyme
VKALGTRTVVDAILHDWRTAPIDERLRATLGFLEKLTILPADVGPSDLDAVRAAGVSDAAIREALYVAFVFGVMDRLADSFGFELPDARSLRWTARILLNLGYKTASVPT